MINKKATLNTISDTETMNQRDGQISKASNEGDLHTSTPPEESGSAASSECDISQV